jgi:hypothetical protein
LIYDLHVTGGDEKAEAGEGDGPGQAHHPWGGGAQQSWQSSGI